MIVVGTGIVLNSVYVTAVHGLMGLPLEIAAFSFAAIWPLASFALLKLWVLT